MVDSETASIEIFRLNENRHWELEEYNNTAESFEIQAINTTLSFAEVYEGSGLM